MTTWRYFIAGEGWVVVFLTLCALVDFMFGHLGYWVVFGIFALIVGAAVFVDCRRHHQFLKKAKARGLR